MIRYVQPFLLLVMALACQIASADTLRIGVSLGLSGSYALTSGKQKNAYYLFEEDINASGGVLGKEVEFVIWDNRSEAKTAISQYEKLITEEKVDFVIGPYTSSLTLAIAPVVEKYGYPTLVAGAAADKIWQQGYTNIFGMWTPASKYVLGFLKLMKVNGLDGIVIVTGDGAFASGLASGTEKWAKALRLKVFDHIEFAEGKKDFRDIAERVRKTSPTIVICTGHYYVGVSMKKAFHEIGWHPAVFYATVSPTFQQYYDEIGDDSRFDFSTAIWEPHPKLKYPGSAEFVKRYVNRFSEQPTYHSASAYAAGEVLIKAIRKAGTIERNVVRTTLQNLNTESVIGRYAVDKTGIQIKRFPLIVQWQNGEKEIVWPEELQTSPVRFRERE